MKKRLFTLIAVASVAFLAAVGCAKHDIDTAKVRAAMQSIDGGQKALLEEGLSAIDAGKYKDALLPLRKVAFGAKLDKDQSKILRDTLTNLQRKIAAGP